MDVRCEKCSTEFELEGSRMPDSEFERALKLNKKYAPASIGLAETQRLWGNKTVAVEYDENALKGLPLSEAADTVGAAMETLTNQ